VLALDFKAYQWKDPPAGPGGLIRLAPGGADKLASESPCRGAGSGGQARAVRSVSGGGL
jgi:hypothetical protein